ncbi:hypothetical protein BDY17DRAFT_79269 [Neohortaea acidophila]|uniref:Uncharacterized protein n=1 Tax=Neohortaea acidophila TaxID=245834 RepID=A0A6A6Q219_9PEZI|nr:uncharacterized protein BDY17DRAFT_79269 [Neohortaea acidophila]KAF2486440.1 hypothetical protein BDY17DRAFT_79269 [Neohortaea acidophila]
MGSATSRNMVNLLARLAWLQSNLHLYNYNIALPHGVLGLQGDGGHRGGSGHCLITGVAQSGLLTGGVTQQFFQAAWYWDYQLGVYLFSAATGDARCMGFARFALFGFVFLIILDTPVAVFFFFFESVDGIQKPVHCASNRALVGVCYDYLGPIYARFTEQFGGDEYCFAF